MFIAAEDLGNALNVLMANPCFPESNKTDTEDAGTEQEFITPQMIEKMFHDIVTVCGSVAFSSASVANATEGLKGLFEEINDLKEAIEKYLASQKCNDQINEESSVQTDAAEEKSAEQKSEIIESRVTGSEGPAAPMM